MDSALRGISLALPGQVRGNNDLARDYPETYQKILARAAGEASSTGEGWDAEMLPFLSDPFRGALRRYAIADGETAYDVQEAAVRSCLEASDVQLEQLDLVMVAATFQSQPGPGDAAYLGARLGLKVPAINVESACSGALVSMKLADALITAGQYERILIVASCTYSHIANLNDPFAWWCGDAAGSILLTRAHHAEEGIRAIHAVDTLALCHNTFYCELEVRPDGTPAVRMRTSPRPARRPLGDVEYAGMDSHQDRYVRETTSEALKRSGKNLEDIDFMVVNTPMAWFADYVCRLLNFDRSKTISTFPEYSNIGVVLPIANAVHAAREGHIKPGDTVLFYSMGSVSTAVAAVVDWGDVAVAEITSTT